MTGRHLVRIQVEWPGPEDSIASLTLGVWGGTDVENTEAWVQRFVMALDNGGMGPAQVTRVWEES